MPLENPVEASIDRNLHSDILETNGIAWPNSQMWRRPPNNPAVPVPTYHPDDGPDSHIHSPRRKSYGCRDTGSSGVTMNTLPSAAAAQATPALGHAFLPQGLSVCQKTPGISASSEYVDPFSDAAYQEWVASMGLAHQQQGYEEPKTIWPNIVTQNRSGHTGHDLDESCMPETLASTIHQTMGPDQMGMSSAVMDEVGNMDNLKVPTNTPITANDGGAGAIGLSKPQNLVQCKTDAVSNLAQLGDDFPKPAVSGELAQSLTHSLLNQPHPLHGTFQFAQPHNIPLPAFEVRSRKENRYLNNASLTRSPSSDPSPSIEAQIRKFSQTSNAFGVVGHERDSSATGPSYSRRSSAGEFGVNVTNQATPSQTYAGVAASITAPGSGSEKGTKRNRTFTPASAKAIDEEDEPRRVDSRVRVATTVPSDDEGQDRTGE